MTTSLLRKWNAFFFAPQSPTPMALFRILYGTLVIANLVLLRSDWLTWYGPRGAVTLETMRGFAKGARLDLFAVIPQTDFAVTACFWAFLASAICLTLGFMTRLSSIAVYVWVSSICERDYFILNGGDYVMRLTGFLLIFAPAGAAISVDRLLRVWHGSEGVAIEPRNPWAQRMIQIQMSVAYIATFWWKALSKAWMNGTALYYILHIDAFRRFPVPWLDHPFVTRLGTWATMLIELSAGTLVWIRRLRYPVLLAALLLHMTIEYSMNIPLFEWVMVSTFVTFIYPEDLSRAWDRLRRYLAPRLGAPVSVVYNAASPSSRRAANVLQVLDVLGRLNFLDFRSAQVAGARFDTWEATGRHDLTGPRRELLILTPAGARAGVAGVCAIAPLIPLLWPLAPLALLERHARRALRAAIATR